MSAQSTSLANALPQPRTTPLKGGPTLRWGVLAPGEIAADFVHALHSYTDQRVHAVASRSAERAERFAAHNGIERSYGSYEQLVADPHIDIVYVSSPNSEHRRLALLAIAAGKHVLVEKPMGTSAADAREIVDAARAAGVFAMEAMWSRYLPQTDVIRQLLDDGVLGEITVVTADFGANFMSEPDGIVFRPELGGGVLRDIGIYALWFSSFVLGSPESIVASGSFTDSGVDGQAAMILTAPSGAQSLLSTTMYADTPTVATISGSTARIEIDSPFLMPGGFTLHSDNGGAPITWNDASGLLLRDGLAWESVGVAQHIADGLTESPLHPLDETLSVLRTLDEVRRQITPHPAL
ncbi:MAG: Gfo/Idh/MocA family oxidoreductase [Lacisediminihabitans sp.]